MANPSLVQHAIDTLTDQRLDTTAEERILDNADAGTSFVGLAGPKGATGASGVTGPTGAAGPTGPAA